jgi:HEAT repeat protein/Na+/melibiose symporter-like transporter
MRTSVDVDGASVSRNWIESHSFRQSGSAPPKPPNFVHRALAMAMTQQTEDMATTESTATRTPTNVEKLRGLPWGVAWSVTNSVFAQYTFFGSIFVLFLNELGLDKAQIGSLLSLLPFLGIVALFIASAVARIGFKRVFIVSMAARTSTAAMLLFIPAILAKFGDKVGLAFILITVSVFGLFRATGFTAFYPWLQEQVPDAMRGKYTAIKNALASLSAFLAMMAAGYVLGPDPDLGKFLILVSVGVCSGFISVWTATKIPGGEPTSGDTDEQGSYREMVAATRDPNLVSYLVGVGLITLATGPLVSFVPLFMKEQVGLSSDQVVWLETGILLGGLASSYLWGWLADRYGSKPVMVSGVYLLPILPLAWLLMPRQVSWALYVALAIALAQGFINTGWSIGSGRILFTRVVPVQKRGPYLALYYAWMGLVGGLGQLFGGWLVDSTAGLQGQWWVFHLDPYTPLFVVALISPLAGYLLLRQVKADSSVTVRQFAGMFLRGNPFLAMESLVRYHRARDERAAIAMTERLGSTSSPLTIEELLEALQDPRFFVRFEAIVSIARRGPDSRLTDALIETLEGDEPALSTLAAWALGRIGDEHALEALRRGLNARYRSVQAHCARSLGSLGDRTVLPILLQRLAEEEDVGLQLALAAALGMLGATEAIDPLLDLLRTSDSSDARVEFTLALARLVGDEHHFIQLQRRVQSEPGTALSQAATALKGDLVRSHLSSAEIQLALDAAAEALAQDDLAQGVDLLRGALQLDPIRHLADERGTVVRECIAQVQELGLQRIEYVTLALHALHGGLSG